MKKKTEKEINNQNYYQMKKGENMKEIPLTEEISNLIIELKVNESNGDENFRIQKHEEILAKLLVQYKLTLKEIGFLKGVI